MRAVFRLNHCTVGMGWPVAVQTRRNLVPTVTVCDDSGGSITTIGASVIKISPLLGIMLNKYVTAESMMCAQYLLWHAKRHHSG